MNYNEFKEEDFLYDEFFVRWVKNPGPESNHFWEVWIKNHPEKLVILQKAREIILSVTYKNLYNPSDQEYTAVLEKVLKQQPSWTQNSKKDKKPVIGQWYKYAAAIILFSLLSAIILYYQNFTSDVDEGQTVAIVKESPLGQKLTFELSDGTVVKLNAGSKLVFSDRFLGNKRKVYLEGEAFFTVKRDESKPFIVQTAQLTTTVLGTSFNVAAYKDDASSVAVLSGKVKVNKAGDNQPEDTYYLTENQMITISSETNSIVKTNLIGADMFSWKDNVIEFDKADFQQIVKRLERWYGVQINIEKHGQFEGLFTGRYDDEPLDLVLEGLKGEYDFQFTIINKDVRIY